MHSSDCQSGQAGNKSSSNNHSKQVTIPTTASEHRRYLDLASSGRVKSPRRSQKGHQGQTKPTHTHKQSHPQHKLPTPSHPAHQAEPRRLDLYRFLCLFEKRMSTSKTIRMWRPFSEALMAEQEEGGVKEKILQIIIHGQGIFHSGLH